ncbi:phytase [Pseudidiomarina sp. YC-516-91]|uniref:phytase n=1 Tax=Pseudidiomarina salilacus TaxID=3384452 RepID=UPI003984ADA0
MKFHLSLIASSLLCLSACAESATDTPVRHQVALGTQQLKADAAGLKLDQQQLEAGTFVHLRTQPLADGTTVFGAMEANTQELYLWHYADGEVSRLWSGEITSRVVEDLCFYQSTENQQLSVFLLGGRGGAEQWLLRQEAEWLAQPLVIRDMAVPYDSTACAVDQAEGGLYIAEGDQAIWRYEAEPEAEEGRDLIAARAPFGAIENEIKALTWLADGSLLALEEEPPRVLVLRRNADNVLAFSEALAIEGAAALTDIEQQADGSLLLTEEDLTASARLTVSQGEARSMTLPAAVNQVSATLETEPSPRRGDAIDDPAVWVHPQQPAQSRILGTDKRTGLYVYDMQGKIVQELAVGRLNNVDVRGQLAAASLRDDNSLQLFSISARGELSLAANIPTDLAEIYGLCMGHDSATDTSYVYVNGKSGRIQQYRVSADGGELVRELQVPSQPEGCAVDDAGQRLFVGEEDVAVWLFDAAADGAVEGAQIITVAEHPELVDDIEGVAYAVVDDQPLLFVSSQGNDSYIVFDGAAPWSLRSHFRIRTNVELGLDGASETDGIEVTTLSLGTGFEQGAFMVQDGRNRMPEAGQNIKLVPLEQILATME